MIFVFGGQPTWAAGTEPKPSIAARSSPFEVNPALEIQLVAAEPLLASPVAMAFDEAGRLYVVEMLDYPDKNDQAIGRVVVLEDSDGDGRFDRRTVFADKLTWPTGIACYRGGVFVSCTPDLIYLKDTKGAGRADLRQVVFTGFGQSVPNPAGDMVVNGFAWSLDHRLYGSTASNGGRITKAGTTEPAIDLKGRDFSIDPVALTLRPESGTGQYGVSFDDFGRRFATSNSRHLMMVMYDYSYAVRNPYFELPKPLLDIPADGPAAEVYRISPEEEWRVVRTQWRVSGKVAGMIEGGGRSSGYFTSACSATIYRGEALPREFYGNAFVAEPTGNLVHRKILSPDGVALIGRRAPEEQKTEVLRSSDLLFRPVNFANGPDGALYIVDMHRQLIEIASGLPDEIRRNIDVYAGQHSGRIYRLAAKGNRPGKLPTLMQKTTAELVAVLENRNAWMRETAARLLYERQDKSTATALENLAEHSPLAYARVHALYALDGLRALQPRQVRRAIGDPEAEVREHAVKLAERILTAKPVIAGDAEECAALRALLLRLAADPAERVRYQLAFTIGELPAGKDADDALFTIASSSAGDRWIAAASLNAMKDNVYPLFLRVTSSDAFLKPADGVEFVAQMLGMVGARANRAETEGAVAFLARCGPEETQMKLVNAFYSGLKRANLSLATVDPQGKLAGVFLAASVRSRDRSAAEDARLTAIRLAAENPARGDELFYELLSPTEPQRVQIEAIAALGRRQAPTLASEFISRWSEFTARGRQEAIRLLIAQPARTLAMLEAIRTQKISRADLSASQVQSLKNHPDERVRATAKAVFEATGGSRQKVIDEYMVSLTLPPDPAHGRDVFRAACMACHRLDGEGFEVGPNLIGVKNRGKEGILIDILDPNRKVDPAYLFYEIVTQKGDIVMGTIAAETPGSITVKQPYGDQAIIPRANIKTMKASPQSFMPDGLEAAIKPKDMADLLQYILEAQ